MADKDPSHYFWRNRWSKTDAPTGASAASALSPALGPNARTQIETWVYSIWNSNAAQTVQAQLRVASAGGTVIASMDNLLAATAVQQVVATALGIPVKRGQRAFATFNTAVASLTTKVTIAGWIDDADG
jgi:hypothetical protein